MSAGAPWSVKGIDPKAREVAKELARRSGMTLGEWLNRVILEDDVPEEVTAEEQFAGRPRRTSHDPNVEAFRPAALAPQRPDSERIALVLERLTDHIAAAETRNGLAVSGVEHSVRLATARIDTTEREHAQLLNHLKRLEAEPAGPRSEEVLRTLEARVADVESRTGAALDSLKGALVGLDGRLASVERTPTLDGERRLAEMGERVQVAERRSTQAVEQIGRQVLSMAEAVSRKLTEVDERSAEAIDQVGSEVARIASAVELRLARAEHTQTEAFERLGRELGRVRESLDLQPAAALAEERLAPGEIAAQVTIGEAAPQDEFAAIDPQPEAIAEMAESALPPPPSPEPEDSLAPLRAAARLASSHPESTSPLLVPDELHHDVQAEDETEADWPTVSLATEAPADRASAFSDPEEDIFEVESRILPEGAPPPLSTREVIEQARATARAAKVNGPQLRAKVGRNAATGRFFRGFGSRKAKTNSTLQTALMVAGGAAFLSLGAAGLTQMEGARPKIEHVAVAGPTTDAPRAGIALGPAGFAPPGRAATAPADPATEFPSVQADVEADRLAGVDRLKALAAAAYPPAQLYLAQLLESGAHGQVQNLVEARRLTALAAEAGEPKAMHNLAVYFFRGDGGAQDLASAAQWFRKAAAAGVVESQFNLGLVYQSGSGVTKDLTQARQWFERAAASGDAEAREAALALDPKRAAPAAPLGVSDAQRILARLGYYQGAADGRVNPAFRTALAGYQRQHGRQPTGALDPATVSALSVYRR